MQAFLSVATATIRRLARGSGPSQPSIFSGQRLTQRSINLLLYSLPRADRVMFLFKVAKLFESQLF
mgnify:CR=1 FL=1